MSSQQSSVHLGFEVGSGEPVSIPLRHMVVTGQTQEAGKTTALEALIARSGVKAVVFVTKRGEGSFADARTIRPYFRERTDWKFVAAILEASRGEKLKFERPWIIRASRGARTLADVHRNVRKAMETAKGLAGDIYLTLDAYLEDVVPQIGRVRWADKVELGPSVNAMDLVALSDEMQQLVIRSSLEWVAEHENDTVVVVPEAWKFIPQGRGTPVKLEAESYIRQGAGLRNYLWLDSQDIAGVEKIILKSVPVWILGVQRESNEVKRTLAQIPAGIKKPKPEAVATLGLGEFYVCHGHHITKVYAQPAWMGEMEAQAIAQGNMDRPSRPPSLSQEVPVNEREARDMRETNKRLEREVGELREKLTNALDLIEKLEGKAPSSNASSAAAHRREDTPRRGDVGSTPAGAKPVYTWDRDMPMEDLYLAIKERLIAELPSDPAVMRIVTSRPELRVEVERHVIEVDGSSVLGRIAQLIADGFFDDGAKTSGDVADELQRRGGKDLAPNVAKVLVDLTRMGFFTRNNKWFTQVKDAKVNIVEGAGV